MNRVWFIDLELIPLASGTLDFSVFKPNGSKTLPVVKLVDNFDAQYSYIANEGSKFIFQTNLNAPLYRCAGHLMLDSHNPEIAVTSQDMTLNTLTRNNPNLVASLHSHAALQSRYGSGTIM